MRRRTFVTDLSLLLGGSFLLGENLFAETKNFSRLNDAKKRDALLDIINSMKGKYTFPVAGASEETIRNALTVTRPPYPHEFGAPRPGDNIHKGVDITNVYGRSVVSFADGIFEFVGRNENSSDHGNLVVINHGVVEGGYELRTYYLHIGGINGIKAGDNISMGDVFSVVDCTGISYKRYSPKKKKMIRGFYINTPDCQEVAHLHFQIAIGDMYINPRVFLEHLDSLYKLRIGRLALMANPLESSVRGFKGEESLGSFVKKGSGSF